MHTKVTTPRIFEAIAQSLDPSLQKGQSVLVLHDVTLERENQKRIQMQERLATVGQLAAGIAHDFNNIMAAIVVYTDLLMMETHLSSGGQERLIIIQKQIQRASSLISQILDFASFR
jgi:signal transduction histidine kinase